MKYPDSFLKLIEDFKKFPGIGNKTAERLALFTLSSLDKEAVESFSTHLLEGKDKDNRLSCLWCFNGVFVAYAKTQQETKRKCDYGCIR